MYCITLALWYDAANIIDVLKGGGPFTNMDLIQ